MAALTGTMSWFCCGNSWGPCGTAGHGACGTCNSGSYQHAWPNASAACFNITRPDTCGISMTRRGCGFRHYTTNRCNGKRIGTTIADCGPQTDLWCGERACCGSVCGTNRIVDLTPAAYSQIASLSSGLQPCSVDSV
ncbi:septal ring lytic transglycosylase RlpA family protein [Catellatospora vulcania]|uniref:septal ring lytic transglycosylase RlpA family protein n=1 Tax=Catellatospora vulcania TaxID=1460450 RepID=UPI001E3631C7|nr:septal ring lytic transglycosylase RlpA family protein [Catellatospora vulcania]